MIKKVLLLPFLLIFFVGSSYAQRAYCGQQKAMNQLTNKLPNFQDAVQQTFEDAQWQYQNTAQSRSNELLTVNVVVHVVYNTEVQNIPDELIHEQMAILNEDFQYLNPDKENARDSLESRENQFP